MRRATLLALAAVLAVAAAQQPPQQPPRDHPRPDAHQPPPQHEHQHTHAHPHDGAANDRPFPANDAGSAVSAAATASRDRAAPARAAAPPREQDPKPQAASSSSSSGGFAGSAGMVPDGGPLTSSSPSSTRAAAAPRATPAAAAVAAGATPPAPSGPSCAGDRPNGRVGYTLSQLSGVACAREAAGIPDPVAAAAATPRREPVGGVGGDVLTAGSGRAPATGRGGASTSIDPAPQAAADAPPFEGGSGAVDLPSADAAGDLAAPTGPRPRGAGPPVGRDGLRHDPISDLNRLVTNVNELGRAASESPVGQAAVGLAQLAQGMAGAISAINGGGAAVAGRKLLQAAAAPAPAPPSPLSGGPLADLGARLAAALGLAAPMVQQQG